MEEDDFFDGSSMDESPTKTKIADLLALKSMLTKSSWTLPTGEDWPETILEPILEGLHDDDSQVCLQALDCLVALVSNLDYWDLCPHARKLVLNVGETMGDSRLSIREKTTKVLTELVKKLHRNESGGSRHDDGLLIHSILEGLKPACKNRNTRMRQEAAQFLSKMMLLVPNMAAGELRLVQEQFVSLASDSNSEIRKTSITAMRHLVEVHGEEILKSLEYMGLRTAQLRQLTEPVPAEEKEAAASVSSSRRKNNNTVVGNSNFETTSTQQQISLPPSVTARRGHGKNEKESVVAEHVEIACEVIPLTPSSERQLLQEMDVVGKGLRASEDEWQARVEALRKLQQLAVGGAGRYESFVPSIQALHQQVASQVCSLRSAVSKEGFITVSVLAQSLKEDFAPLADLLAPAILRMTQTNILITAMSADQCLRCMVCCSRLGFPRLLPILLEGTAVKNDTERLRCVTAITLALWLWEEESIERHLEGVILMLKTTIADKKEGVRAAARQCYWAFHRKFLSEAEVLMDGLEPGRQKHLSKERGILTPSFIESLIPKQRYRVIKNDAMSSPSSPSTPAILPDHQQDLPPHHQSVALREGGGGATTSTLRLFSHAPQQDHRPGLKAGPTRRQSLSGLPMRVAASASPAAAAPFSSEVGPGKISSTTSTSSSGRLGGVLPPLHHRPHKMDKEEEAEDLDFSTDTHELPTHPPPPPISSTGGRRLSISGPSLRIARHPPVNNTAATTTQDVVAAVGALPANAMSSSSNYDRKSWESILKDVESPTWNERLHAFEAIVGKIRDLFSGTEDGKGELPPMLMPSFARVLVSILQHTHDSNFRVAQAAMEALVEFMATIENSQEVYVSQLEILLPKLLSKIMDPKEHIRALAGTALEICQSQTEASLLCTSLCRLLHDLPERQKVAALDLLRLTIPSSSSWLLSQASSTRNLMSKLATILVTSPGLSLQRSASACVLALYEAKPALFVEQLSHLATECQLSLRRVLNSHEISADWETAVYQQQQPAALPTTTSLDDSHTESESSPMPMPMRMTGGPATRVARRDPPNKPTVRSSSHLAFDDDTEKENVSRATTLEVAGGVGGGKSPHCTTSSLSTPPPPPSSKRRASSSSSFLLHTPAADVIPWAIDTLSDELLPSWSKAQALEEMIAALRRADASVWERYLKQILHLFLQEIHKAAQEEQEEKQGRGLSELPSCPLLFNAQTEVAPPSTVYQTPLAPGKTPRSASVSASVTNQKYAPRVLPLRGLRYIFKLISSRHEKEEEEEGLELGPYLDMILARLLSCAVTDSYEVFQQAERTINALIYAVPNELLYQTFLTAATREKLDVPALLLALRSLTKLFNRLGENAAELVSSSLSLLVPTLVDCMASQEIVVRMTAVTTLAEIYQTVGGEVLFPHLQHRLHPAQMKLVTIYVNRQGKLGATTTITPTAGSSGSSNSHTSESEPTRTPMGRTPLSKIMQIQ